MGPAQLTCGAWSRRALPGILGLALLAGGTLRAADAAVPETPLPVLSRTAISSHMGGEDPIEGFNRSIFYVADFFFYWIYRPVGTVYGSIMPRPAVDSINNLTDNLEFPRRFLSCLLQAKFTGSGIELTRFLTNSTLGIAGLFDPARHWFGLRQQNEDFGQAFASWGIGPGCVLQLNTSTNIRDAAGMIFDYAVDIKSYFYGGQAFTFLNRGLDTFPQYDAVRKSTFDSYQALKDYQLLVRYLQLNDWQPLPLRVEVDEHGEVVGLSPREPEPGEMIAKLPDFYPQSAPVDTLRVDWFRTPRDEWWVYLSWFNRDFRGTAEIREVEVYPGSPLLSYRMWTVADHPEAPLVVILPGLGGNNDAMTAAALAQLCHRNGMAAVVVSNTMNWEFLESTAGAPPGYTPDDAVKLRDALGAVLDDIRQQQRHGAWLDPERVAIVGYSQGGLNALFLADMEMRDPYLGIDRYLAIDPPVDLMKALAKLDEYYRSLDDMGVDKALALVAMNAGNYLYTSPTPAELHRRGEDGSTPPAETPGGGNEKLRVDQVPVERQAAQMLIGYSFKRTLEDMLVCMHHRHPVNGIATPYRWGDRQALYDELAAWSFQRYCTEVLLPYYSERRGKPVTLDELNAEAGLRAIEPALRHNPRLRVIHTADDFLLDREDREYLRRVLGDRLTVFEHGGHLGNLYREEVQNRVVEYFKAP